MSLICAPALDSSFRRLIRTGSEICAYLDWPSNERPNVSNGGHHPWLELWWVNPLRKKASTIGSGSSQLWSQIIVNHCESLANQELGNVDDKSLLYYWLLMMNRWSSLVIFGGIREWLINHWWSFVVIYLESAETKSVSLTTLAMLVWPALLRGLYLWWKAHQGQRGGSGRKLPGGFCNDLQHDQALFRIKEPRWTGSHLSTVWRRGGLSK